VECLGVPDQRAAHALARVAHQLAERFAHPGARIVLTHAYEGGHPDHDATAFAVHAAARLMQQSGAPAPHIVELTGYHLRDGRFVTGEFLPADAAPERCVTLSAPARALKRRMLDCFHTQAETLTPFGVECERFRRAPRYRFTEPPHPGSPLYDAFPWGLRSAEWPDLIVQAAGRLELEPNELP
jgi:LmbE family N-acetylglucosaminyl deacetylase